MKILMVLMCLFFMAVSYFYWVPASEPIGGGIWCSKVFLKLLPTLINLVIGIWVIKIILNFGRVDGYR